MEIIFLAGAAAIVWLYLFNTTLCYVVVGGGYLAILLSLISSRILKARRLKVGMAVRQSFGDSGKSGSFSPTPTAG